MNQSLHVLCAGAVQGVVTALRERFEAENGTRLHTRFGAVGAMKEALCGGEPCDVLIVTDAMVGELQTAGHLARGPSTPLGHVRTGVAVRSGAARPDVSSPEALRTALLAASAIYFPDPRRATAGVHFAKVLVQLGIVDAVAAKTRNYPNGATAMRHLAAGEQDGIGCTQITEILYTSGITLVGPLPEACGLATVYAAAVSAHAGQPLLAQRLVDLLGGSETRAMRAEGGFEFDRSTEEKTR